MNFAFVSSYGHVGEWRIYLRIVKYIVKCLSNYQKNRGTMDDLIKHTLCTNLIAIKQKPLTFSKKIIKTKTVIHTDLYMTKYKIFTNQTGLYTLVR